MRGLGWTKARAGSGTDITPLDCQLIKYRSEPRPAKLQVFYSLASQVPSSRAVTNHEDPLLFSALTCLSFPTYIVHCTPTAKTLNATSMGSHNSHYKVNSFHGIAYAQPPYISGRRPRAGLENAMRKLLESDVWAMASIF